VAEKKLRFSVLIEAPNQPSLNGGHNPQSERKKPDIQFTWVNPQETDVSKYQREYTVECKRLGEPLNGRCLCEEYVTKGINRFVTPEHSYANGCPSGVMVGYVQNWEPQEILVEVNSYTIANHLAQIQLQKSGWQVGGITELDHTLNRNAVYPSNFLLYHFWADFRNKDNPTAC
jgi:hypothetical protein